MLRFLAQHRFNYIDYLSIATASGLFYSDQVLNAVIVFNIGIFLSLAVEIVTGIWKETP